MRFCGALTFLPRVLRAEENAGVAAIEFAIFATVFVIILAGTVDIGTLVYTASQLDAAVKQLMSEIGTH